MTAVDLHVHSTKSDGSLTPSELVDKAISKNLSAFALTDHDCTDGIDEALEYAKGKPVEVIPGIELSTGYEGKDIHIVGLDINHKSDAFQEWLVDFRASRERRNEKMCAKLREEAGINITYEELKAMDPGAVITRSHYGKYLLSHGYVKSIREAFDRYIGDRAKCFVAREKITPSEGIKIILRAGGIPVLAHPILYGMSKQKLSGLVAGLKEDGLIGIEAIYSTYSPSDEREIKTLAKEYDLAISGGSDYHGEVKPGLDMGTGYGKLFIPDEVLTNLRAKKKNG